jgi:hypothetical protein
LLRKSFAQRITQLPAFEVRSSDRENAQPRLALTFIPADQLANPSNDRCFSFHFRHETILPEPASNSNIISEGR